MNATVRLVHYLEHNQSLPSHQDLLPHLEAETLEHKVALEALAADEEVALGSRHWHVQLNVEWKAMEQTLSPRATCMCPP